MKIVDWVQGKTLRLEDMDIKERDDLITIPAWQFALLIRKYKEFRFSMLSYFAIAVVMFVFWVWSVYLP